MFKIIEIEDPPFDQNGMKDRNTYNWIRRK